jgi:sodium transport system permease protein
MRLSVVWTIFRKEITEALRDRLTLVVVFGLPLLIYPLSVTMLSRIQATTEQTEERRVSQIAVWGQAPTPIMATLDGTNTLKLEPWAHIPKALREEFSAGSIQRPPLTNATVQTTNSASQRHPAANPPEPENEVLKAAREIVSQKKADAVLVLWPGFSESLDQLDRGYVTIYFDPVRPASDKAADRLRDELSEYRKRLVLERQERLKLPSGFSTPLEIRSTSVATTRREFGDQFGRLLPLLLIMLSATGALYAAVDLTAGEKDRATMQTLLCAPLLPLEIVTGKFLTVWMISLLSALANVASLGFTIGRVAASVKLPTPSFAVLAGVLGLLLLVTCTVAAAFIGVAALARDAKDAGNFLSASLIMLTLPVIGASMPGVELNAWTAFVPIVNISALIKALLIEDAGAELVFLVLVASSAYAMLALVFAARVFGREEILLGGPGVLRELLPGRDRIQQQPTPGLVLGIFAIVLVAAFYGSLLIEKRGIITQVLTVQYVFFLLPVVALAAMKRYPVTETFSLRPPHWRSVLGAILIGGSAALAVAGLTMRLLPPPESLIEGLREVLMLGKEPAPVWIVWLVLAVTPALCEETFFRGFALSGFRRLGPRAAIGISALLFGLAHASIYRLLPTFVLGLVLGYVAWRSGSIFCSMIIHALNNGLIATMAREDSFAAQFNIADMQFVPWTWTFASLAVLTLGLLLVGTSPKQERQRSAPAP